MRIFDHSPVQYSMYWMRYRLLVVHQIPFSHDHQLLINKQSLCVALGLVKMPVVDMDTLSTILTPNTLLFMSLHCCSEESVWVDLGWVELLVGCGASWVELPTVGLLGSSDVVMSKREGQPICGPDFLSSHFFLPFCFLGHTWRWRRSSRTVMNSLHQSHWVMALRDWVFDIGRARRRTVQLGMSRLVVTWNRTDWPHLNESHKSVLAPTTLEVTAPIVLTVSMADSMRHWTVGQVEAALELLYYTWSCTVCFVIPLVKMSIPQPRGQMGWQ